MEIISILSFMYIHLVYIQALPITQSSLFVVSGVETCGHSRGYCMHGNDCTLKDDLESDSKGHCDGLRTAFIPETYFVCCRYANASSTAVYEDAVAVPSTTAPHNDNVETSTVFSDVFQQPPLEMSNVIDDVYPIAKLTYPGAINEADEPVVNVSHLPCCNTSSVQLDDYTDHGTRRIEKFENVNHRSETLQITTPTFFESLLKNSGRDLYSSSHSEMDCTGHQNAELIPKTIVEEFRGASILPEKLDKNKCLNLVYEHEDAKSCINVWKFTYNDQVLCFGTLINSIWLLTSASCIIKIYKEGIESVVATDMERTTGLYNINIMIVHENYKMAELDDLHDVGLVSLNQESNSSCFACIPREERKYADRPCITYVMSTDQRIEESLKKCQDRLKILNMHSKTYLSLPCSSDEQHTLTVNNSTANALWCENYLVGIETSFEEGLLVFTTISEYRDWIEQNVQLYL